MNAAQNLNAIIMAAVMPNPSLGVIHQGNWPTDAEFGVEYTISHARVPSLGRVIKQEYFTNVNALTEWLESKRDVISAAGSDFTMTYSVYDWDLGPNFKYAKTM